MTVAAAVRTVLRAGSAAASPWDIYQDYIDGKREIKEINRGYIDEYRQGRQIK